MISGRYSYLGLTVNSLGSLGQVLGIRSLNNFENNNEIDSLEVNNRKIGVESVCLEEEACQIIKRTKEYDVYNLSRLGIPLIEIATSADIKTPEEARDVASKIGMILRSTGKCKRGIGSIRQDVNLSIKGGARVEIKGFKI